MLHQQASTSVHCRPLPQHCPSGELGFPINSEAITEGYCTRICYVVRSSMSSNDVTRHQFTVTAESCQSTQGGLAQQAGTSCTRRASRDSSCFELTLSHSQQCTHSPVTVCCVSVCVPEPRAVAPAGRDWVGIIWSSCISYTQFKKLSD